jgi:hypothetical protein
VAQDFSSPKGYEVTAKDGTTKQTYTVTVGVAPNTAAEITAFKIGSVSGTISGTNIGVTVPYGTTVTSLTPTISLSAGASVSPTTAQDFSSAKTYTVTAQDGTTKKAYTVTVTVAKNTAALITSFIVDGVNATIDNTNNTIKVIVPYGTAVTPTITVSPKATVSPASGVNQNFASPVQYTVTAEDGTTKKTYTATATWTIKGVISSVQIDLWPINTSYVQYPNYGDQSMEFRLPIGYKYQTSRIEMYYSLGTYTYGVSGYPSAKKWAEIDYEGEVITLSAAGYPDFRVDVNIIWE